MDNNITLEQIIRQYVPLPLTTNANGWFTILCKVCNDHGKKGPRAAFKFDLMGVVGYHCFNCQHKAKFDPVVNKQMPEPMITVLRAFGIPDDQWAIIIFNNLGQKGKSPAQLAQIKQIEPPEIIKPEYFYPLRDSAPDDKWAEIARDYLEHERGIDPNSYPFWLFKGTGIKPIDTKWKGRVVIPVFKNEKLIFYTGRSLYDTIKKYQSPSIAKDRVMFGFERLFENTTAPLYVVEGIFDAMVINGVAILGNELSDAQIEWLGRTRRQKVYIPDRLGDGKRVALDFLEQGWSISTPDIGASCKDMNDAVKKYGEIFVLKSLAENTATGFQGKVQLEGYCEHKSTKGKKENKKAPSKQRGA